jgi:hypothetical protein
VKPELQVLNDASEGIHSRTVTQMDTIRRTASRRKTARISMTMTPVAMVRIEPAQTPRTRLAMHRFVMMMRGDPQRGTDDHHHRWPQQIGQCRFAHRILRPGGIHSPILGNARRCFEPETYSPARLARRGAYAMPTAYVRGPTFADRSVMPDVIQPLIIASPSRSVRPTAMPYPYNIALAAGLMLIVLSCSLALVLT